MAQSMEDSIGLAGGDAAALEALGDEVENILADEVENSPHGSGELGQEDAVARREGYEGIEDKQSEEDAALEQAEEELERPLTDTEVDEILDEMRAGREEADEDEGEDEADYDDEDRPASEGRSYDLDDIVEELGEDAMIRVRIDGEEVEVPVDDLIGGYSRTSDYTRKTQKLAEDRRAMADEAENVRRQAGDYMQKLAMADRLLRESGTDAQIKAVEAEFAAVTRMAAEADTQAYTQSMAAEAELLVSKIPAWQDKDVARAERDDLMRYAINDLGFTPEVLGEISDHRALLILHKAMRYDKMNNEARTAVQAKIKKAPTLKPGQSSKSRRPAAEKRAAKRAANTRAKLKNTGHVRDAQAAILDMLGDELDD